MRETDGGADGLRQRNAEEFGLVKDGDGLYNSNSYMRVGDEIHFRICMWRIVINSKK